MADSKPTPPPYPSSTSTVKPTRTHIMRWAPQDYRTSRVRMRSAMTADPMLRTVYLELLNALHECGGELPSDSDVLADELLLPAAEIARCLPILAELGRHSARGGIVLENGVVRNVRVCEDLRTAQEYRDKQAEFGAEGGKRGGKKRAKGSPRVPKGKPEGTPNQPLPLPTPSVSLVEQAGLSSPARESMEPAIRPGPPANPLVGNRKAEMVAELHALCEEVAKGEGSHADEVYASTLPHQRARGVIQPSAACLSDNELLVSLRQLRDRAAALRPAKPLDLHAERGW